MSEDAFNNEVYSGPTRKDVSIHVHDPRGIAFEATQGITRKEFEEKNREAVNRLFEPQEEIGSVFEKGQKLEEKTLSHERNDIKNDIKSVTNNGIDSNDIDALKKELSDQKKDIKEPSVESSLNFVK